MRVFTARQPILNASKHIVAYELLFRDGMHNKYPAHVSPDIATAKLLINHYLNTGFETITQGKPALINFPVTMLKQQLLDRKPYKNMIIELLETVQPTEENYQILKQLSETGYVLALDDFTYTPEWDRFLPFIRLIKFDIIDTPLDTLLPLIKKLKQQNIQILAEKIETVEEFNQAKAMGFDFYQGYFFCKPDIFVGHDIGFCDHFLSSIYTEVMKDDFDYYRAEELFMQDIGLTYKLLRFVNSSWLDVSNEEITSIRQAMLLLGQVQLQRFIGLIITAQCGDQVSMAMVMQETLVKARMCQLTAKVMGYHIDSDGAFLIGLFSSIDVIMQRPMRDVMQSLPIAKHIKQALLEKRGGLYDCLQISLAYIQGDWETLFAISADYPMRLDHLIASCYNAMHWQPSSAKLAVNRGI